MDPPPPPYKKSVSASRSTTQQLGAMADALLRGPPPRSVSSASIASRDDLKTRTDANLLSSLSHSLSKTSFTSNSVSRSSVSKQDLNAAAEALLLSPALRSVSSPASFFPTESRSVDSTAQIGSKGRTAAMPSPSVSRTKSSSVSSMSSWASSVSSRPPSYRTSQQSSRPGLRVQESAKDVISNSPARSRSSGSSVGSPSLSSVSSAESKRRVRQMLSAVDKATASVPSRNTKGLFKAMCSTDLLFLIDTTTSMQMYIDAAKDHVRSIITDIQHTFLGESIVRIAVVGYTDHCNSPNVQFLDFTTSMDQVRQYLDDLKTARGGGWTADALGGIHQASNANWMQKSRCIIHIADAPGHSRALHDMPEAQDSQYYRPGSEPHGLTFNPVIQLLVKLNINYTFLRIHSCTDRMVMAFSRVYDAAGADSQLLPDNKYYKKASVRLAGFVAGSNRGTRSSSINNSPQLLFQELPLGIDTSKLQRLVLKSVTDSITRTSSRHSIALNSKNMGTAGIMGMKKQLEPRPMLSAVREDEEEAVDVALEAGPPQWNSPGWLDKIFEMDGSCPDVVVYSDSTLADMMRSDDNIKLSFAQMTIHARSRPFKKGTQRMASYARIAASVSQFVVKSFINGDQGMEHMIEDMRVQALCKAFALEFNGLVRPEQAIDFVMTACLQSKAEATSGKKPGYLSLEPYIGAKYIKYNNNALWVNEDLACDPINQVAQAFSHFTFERSWGHFMVVDLQGVGNLLTDPVVHTVDPQRFKLNELNFHSDGFKFFFANHGCNEVCQQLGLVSNRDMAASGDWSFRRQWPAIDATVCCSNKLCQSIIRLARAHSSTKFPGYRWCNTCWPQIQAPTARWICAAPGDLHEFDMCRFFYVSQCKLPPRKCPQHVEKDTTAINTATIGGGLWNQMKSESKRTVVLGNDY